MVAVRTPLILRVFDGSYLTCSVPASEKVVYLTFDDGPIPEITPVVLGILKERTIPATFFCVGENVKKYPEIFRQVTEAGHAIGNHTFHHLNGWITAPAEYVEDVTRCDEYFTSGLFRPPFGRFTPSQYFLLRKKYRFILWSVLSGDYNHRISKERCLQNVLTYAKSGSIVVFHDSLKASENMFYALPRFIDHFLNEGYKFKKIETVDA